MGETVNEISAERPVLLRINIPSCSRACSFCDRCLMAGRDTARLHAYVMALAKELTANAPEFQDCRVKAIHLGGGTASIIDGNDFDHLMRLIRSEYKVDEDVPVSMRVCPADINGANQPFYNRCHVTMYHLEMLALDPDDYIHLDYLQYRESLPYIAHGFLRAQARNDMGFVLLYGKKTRGRWGFRRSVLETARRSDVAHVILQRCTGDDAKDEEGCRAELAEAAQILKEHGFAEYTPQHWAKPGCEDAYYAGHAAGMEELGFGLGAETRFDAMVTKNTSDLDTYLRYSGDFARITASAEPIEA